MQDKQRTTCFKNSVKAEKNMVKLARSLLSTHPQKNILRIYSVKSESKFKNEKTQNPQLAKT